MVDKVQSDISGDILVEFDYDNIIVVDPNKTQDSQGNISERLVDHENLVMFVNLEAEVLPRTKLAIGGAPNNNITTISVGKINFLKPNNNSFFSSGYYDELTGKGSTNFNGVNQIKEEFIPESNGSSAFIKQSPTNNLNSDLTTYDNGLLGITSVNVRTSSSFVPSVTIELEDVQGRALFQLGENSPYAAFFNLPYPPFYLTMKGYFGKAIKYQLNLINFNARFDSSTGNYKVTLELKGYKFNILNEISMGYLLATPHMYSTRFDVIKQQTNTGNNLLVDQIVAEKGYQKIHEVYTEYKAAKLIDENFPELTFQELMVKLQNFEKNIISNYPKVNIDPLTNIKNYKKILNNFYSSVRGGETSWFFRNLNTKPFYKKSGEKFYVFKSGKEGLANSKKIESLDRLKKIIKEYNDQLLINPTLGKKGTDEIKKQVTFESMTGTCTFNGQSGELDINKTYTEQTGILNPTNEQLQVFYQSLVDQGIFFPIIYSNQNDPQNSKSNEQPFFFFEGDERFDTVIREIEAEANKKLADYEVKISAELAKKIEDTNTGLGFRPSVKNIVAIIMASAEAFIRLLDEVHTKAWDVKYDRVRKNAILETDSSVKSSDYVDVVPNININGSNNTILETPVYPWPQFFVDTNNGVERKFELKYIGDPSVVQLTQGYLYDKWPEVEFVEQYLKGLIQKFSAPQYQPATDNQGFTNLLNINAIEFPQTGLPYSNKEEIKFFYEIWERQYLTSHYTNLFRLGENNLKNKLLDLLIEVESTNLINSLGVSNPYLNSKLKNYGLNSSNYLNVLETISNNGTGKSWQNFIRDSFITPYINTLTTNDNTFSIIELDNLGKTSVNKISSNILEDISNSQTTNKITLMELYPFTNNTWVTNNMISSSLNQGDLVFNTNKTLKVFQQKNVFSNFLNINDYSINRPVTNFVFQKPENPLVTSDFFDENFFTNRTTNKLVPTEGYCYFEDLRKRTTSILNTPFFINSIQKGVQNLRNNNKYPFVEASFLFVNSLPLISLRERYKGGNTTPLGPNIPNTDSGLNNLDDLDYMFASLKKFGAIHKLPYAWILKIGSLWYRYKLFVENGVDILNNIWTDFDYKKNFDPVNQDVNKKYTLTINGNNQEIQLENDSNNNISVQSGFYPNLINDFCEFYNGTTLYTNYTNTEIQNSLDNGLYVYNFSSSNIDKGNTSYRPWSVLLKSTLSKNTIQNVNCAPITTNYSDGFYIVPSFGSQINQVNLDLTNFETNIIGNKSVYNGSVRLLWASPNYGYFDSQKITKPQTDSYVNKINGSMSSADLPPFNFLGADEYSKIEEIFSVFEKNILDSFEEEFLNFSKPLTNLSIDNSKTYTYNQSTVSTNDLYKNFQLLFKTLMYVSPKNKDEEISKYFENTIEIQYENFTNVISNFLRYDVIFRYGNPSGFNRRVFDSFLSPTQITEPIPFKPYIKDSLPSSNGTTTLLASKQTNPKEWKALELNVGFSTITELVYKDNGSYITDFFIDNNIEFNLENIEILSPLIKMYATQKLSNGSLNSGQFKSILTDFQNSCNSIQNYSLSGILSRLNRDLPDYQQVPERTIQSAIDGQQSKVEAYESFKALNDKWIAGGDYTSKTLFEDILFLDRASRDIGDTILLDIFDLQTIINQNSLNMNMSVFTFISGLLIRNNFNVMNLPAYVNFYNTQDTTNLTNLRTEGPLPFANSMWGTFTTVDYRESSPKMICFYAGKPSQYLDLPKGNFKFRNDGFDMRRTGEVPLLSNGKNKCVGFNVDIGIRNQNIFHTLQVSQENGKATSETINVTLNIANQARGINSATQNVSLYNLYKQRSYQSQVTCMGNALIQPTMYFNLRHVPMFHGPYMITEVNHVIAGGQFQTTFTGVRQGIFDLPSIDNYLQSINLNLLTQLEKIIRNRKEDEPKTKTDSNTKTAESTKSTEKTSSTPSSCEKKVLQTYLNEGYVAKVNPKSTQFNISEIIESVKSTTDFVNLQSIIYAICYYESFKDNKFLGFDNNLGSIYLDRNFGESSNKFMKEYSCVNIETESKPLVNFETLNDFMDFMVSRLSNNISRINTIGLLEYTVCNWPTSERNPSPTDFSKNRNTLYTNRREKLKKGLESFRNNVDNFQISDSQINLLLDGSTTNGQNTSNPQNNLNTTNTNNSCPTPSINSISPDNGNFNTSTVVTIQGLYLYNILRITVNGQECSFTTIDDTKINVIISPNLNGQITIETDHGTVTSSQTFTYRTNSNTSQINSTINSPGSNQPTQTFNIPFTIINSESINITQSGYQYYYILKSDRKYVVFEIVDNNFTPDKVVSVTAYNISNNPVPIDIGDSSNVKLCNVNNSNPGIYYWILKYTPNGPSTQPILTIRSDNWTQ